MPFCQLNNVNVSDILSHPDNLSVSARQPGINLTEIITGLRRRDSYPELQHNWIDPFIIPVQQLILLLACQYNLSEITHCSPSSPISY